MQTAGKNPPAWWKTTTVYQVYPRSFCDSNADGIGDIPGIISKLDYIKDMGFETIWFSPFFSSPQKDFGYDVSDYCDIAPEYGTSEDCRILIEEVHGREMKVLFDLVMNHTSDQHPWFKESRSSRDNPKRSWYIWRDGKKPKGKAPPSNWQSKVSGRGWHYDEATGQWYWAAFLPFQPDLNYRNPDVREAMLNVVRFWLEQGVDGFRLDILGSLYEDEDFRDNPFTWKLLPSPESPDMLFQSRVMTENHPDTFEFVRTLRKTVDEFGGPPRFLVGEVFGNLEQLKQFCGDSSENSGLHSVFLFQTMSTPLRAPRLRSLINDFERMFPEPFTPTWVYGNHDTARRLSILKDDIKKFQLNVLLQFTARGVPFTYYGEEIGMIQSDIPVNDALDPVARFFRKLPRFVQNLLQRVTRGSIARDGCRTPMQWDASRNMGFCGEGATPWLPINGDSPACNVQFQEEDPGSILSLYKNLLHLRKRLPRLAEERFELLPASSLPRSVLGYQRGDLYIYLNFGRRKRKISLPGQLKAFLFSTCEDFEPDSWKKRFSENNGLHLQPWEGIILHSKGIQ